jgi:hypothetical protein
MRRCCIDMKKIFLVCFLLLTPLLVFGQRVYSVGILPFEVSATEVREGEGAAQGAIGVVSPAEAAEATRLVIAELRPVATIVVLEGDAAQNGDYLVRGQISRQNNQIVLSASTVEARTGRVLNTTREQAATLSAIPMLSFCARVIQNIPYPTYYLGRWQATIDTIEGPLISILEFRTNRIVQVERYDTWEHNGTNSLRYQAIGTGTFTFTGHHFLRAVNVDSRQFRVNATFGIDLTLEDALTKYESINVSNLALLFDDSYRSFELVNAGLPCGDNHSGPAVFPSASVYYTRFTRIQ